MSFSHCYEIINRDRFFSSHRSRPLESLLNTSVKIRCRCIVLVRPCMAAEKSLLMKHLFSFSSFFSPSLHQVIFLFAGSLICPSYNINYLKCPAFHKRPLILALWWTHSPGEPLRRPAEWNDGNSRNDQNNKEPRKRGHLGRQCFCGSRMGSCLYFVFLSLSFATAMKVKGSTNRC